MESPKVEGLKTNQKKTNKTKTKKITREHYIQLM